MRSGRDVGSVKLELKNGKEKMTGRRSRATRLEMAGRASVVETGWSLLLRRVRRCILFWDWCLSESSTSRFFFFVPQRVVFVVLPQRWRLELQGHTINGPRNPEQACKVGQ